jgi:hypothetical protein
VGGQEEPLASLIPTQPIPIASKEVHLPPHFIPGDAAHQSQASFVFLDVNPDATGVLRKPMEYMPYSGIAKGSKRGVFLPLLPVLLLFENLKL